MRGLNENGVKNIQKIKILKVQVTILASQERDFKAKSIKIKKNCV